MKNKTYLSGIGLLLLLGLCGCGTTTKHVVAPKADAVAVLTPTQGNTVQGTIYFIKVADGVRVEGEIVGLKPGPHGFHIHEKGDCSAPDAMSAGGHFNPTNMQHGSPTSTQRHMGDFGNIEANAAGIAKVSIVDHMISIEGPYSIINHGLIVHGNPDDLKSQPAGNAGPRVACGVIARPGS
jgi:Cu-Zn family superoxide dismutase